MKGREIGRVKGREGEWRRRQKEGERSRDRKVRVEGEARPFLFWVLFLKGRTLNPVCLCLGPSTGFLRLLAS